MTTVSATDLTVVIPTRSRWEILDRTLEALATQTASGFDVVVVVDGTDQVPPELSPARVLVQEHAGPGAARNRGVAATDRHLVLFLGDDMIPTPALVASHLDAHARHPDEASAVLGRSDWHPTVARNRIARWLDWSGLQFDYHRIEGEEAGWGRFYSSNVSLKRSFFESVGGFDTDFTYDYEDLDIAWRLHERGLRLWYAPDAVAHHLHVYDWASMARRWESHARGERLMASKHPSFEPFFASAVRGVLGRPRPSRLWPVLEPWLPRTLSLRDRARRRSTDLYLQRLAAPFLTAWYGEQDLADLKEYLGDEFDIDLLHRYAEVVEREREAAPDEATFYRTSHMYLYDLTAFAMTGTKWPYLADLRSFLAPPARVLDYGCGIGSDGLRLLDEGYRVEFADFSNPSTQYLRWRLARRGIAAPVHDLDVEDVPSGYDAAYSLDVIEHVDDPFAFLAELERRASIVMVNFLEPDPDDTHLHHPLPIGDLLDHAHRRGILRYRRYHGRSHLVVYRTTPPGLRGRLRSHWQRRLGGHTPSSG